MQKIIAEKIIKNSHLIPGKVSRQILQKIIYDEEITKSMLPDGITVSQINQIKKLYQKELSNFPDKNISPKYFPFYCILKNNIPNFSWVIENNGSNKPTVKISAPRVNNLRISLLSLLLGKISNDNSTPLNYSCIDKLPASAIKTLAIFLETVDAIYPPEQEMSEIVDWILRGLQGETLTIFIPVCPDYSAVPTGDPACPMRHTFDSLGFGNGQIAQRLINALPHLEEMLTALNLKVNIIAGAGDFEAFSESNLKRLNLTEDEFLQRVISSKNAFKNATTVNLSISMITDLCGGKNNWLHYMDTASKQFLKGDVGSTRVTSKILLDIAEKRRSLYSRWYGERTTLEDYIPIVLAQGMEYCALGLMIADHYSNCLVFGGDNDCMRYFYSLKEPIPTLYLKRYYC